MKESFISFQQRNTIRKKRSLSLSASGNTLTLNKNERSGKYEIFNKNSNENNNLMPGMISREETKKSLKLPKKSDPLMAGAIYTLN
jgi:hypothetical protein